MEPVLKSIPVRQVKKVQRVPLRTHDQNGNVITKGIFVDPKSDFGFKRLFGNPESEAELIQLLNALLEDEITPINNLSYLNKDASANNKNPENSLFELLVKDDQDQHYELEMQNRPIDFMLNRTYFNLCKYLSEALVPGKDFYDKNSTLTCVVISNFDAPELAKLSHVSVHQYRSKSTGEVTIDIFKILVVQLTKFNKKLEELNGKQDNILFLLKNLEKLENIPPQFDNDTYRPLFERARFTNFNNQDIEDFNDAYKKEETHLIEIENALNKGIKEGIKKRKIRNGK